MVYQKKRYRRRFKRFGRRYKKSSVAVRALRGVRRLRNMVSGEVKKFDATLPATITGTGSVTHLSGVAQGDSFNNREGFQIYAKSLQIRGTVRYPDSGGDPAVAPENGLTYRIAVVTDTQQVADTTPAISDIFQNADPTSYISANSNGRFKILRNLRFTLDSIFKVSRFINIRIPLRHRLRYNEAAGTDIQKNGLYLVLSSDQEAGAEVSTFTGRTSRLMFYDN